MIDKAQEYVWATGRVLEQRRFEFLFGDGGDPAAVKAALEPYKTSDGGYGYALEPDGRGPTSQPPHIWTALEVLEELGETDSGIGDHIASLTAPDGGVPVALPSLEPYPRAPWWGIGTKGTLLATALLYSRLHGEHDWKMGAEAFCWRAIEGIETTHPYEVESAITFLDAASDRDRQVRIRADDHACVREQLAQRCRLNAREDRYDSRPRRDEPRKLRGDFSQLLRLETENDKAWQAACVDETGDGRNAGKGLAARADDGGAGKIGAGQLPALHHRSGHVAAADQP